MEARSQHVKSTLCPGCSVNSPTILQSALPASAAVASPAALGGPPPYSRQLSHRQPQSRPPPPACFCGGRLCIRAVEPHVENHTVLCRCQAAAASCPALVHKLPTLRQLGWLARGAAHPVRSKAQAAQLTWSVGAPPGRCPAGPLAQSPTGSSWAGCCRWEPPPAAADMRAGELCGCRPAAGKRAHPPLPPGRWRAAAPRRLPGPNCTPSRPADHNARGPVGCSPANQPAGSRHHCTSARF